MGNIARNRHRRAFRDERADWNDLVDALLHDTALRDEFCRQVGLHGKAALEHLRNCPLSPQTTAEREFVALAMARRAMGIPPFITLLDICQFSDWAGSPFSREWLAGAVAKAYEHPCEIPLPTGENPREPEKL